MPRKVVDYSKTVIYKIVCKDLNITELYVGHTTDFTRRKCEHKTCCNNEKSKHHNYKVYQLIRDNGGWDNWNMIEIEKSLCSDSNEARARVREYYETLNSSLNSIHPNRSPKQYREINKEKRKEYKKKYDEDNKEKIKEYKKQYRENNNEKITEYMRQYIARKKLQNLDTDLLPH